MGHSGGKDSTVLLHLTKQVCTNIRIVHNVKPMLGHSGDAVGALTEQHPATLEFLYTTVCVDNAVAFMHSSKMDSYVYSHALECQLDGSRACESDRAGKSSQFIKDGVQVSRIEMTEFEEHGIFGLSICYPLFDWTDDDIFDYIMINSLPISQEYFMNGEIAAYLERKEHGL
jgi:hypothetical protein